MDKSEWIWMPHPAHFICSNYCRFKLATYVGGYIVSTVGEYVPGGEVRIRYEKIGANRTYETMVFKARKSEYECCPYEIIGEELDFEGYNNADSAYKGHLRLCEKWANRKE